MKAVATIVVLGGLGLLLALPLDAQHARGFSGRGGVPRSFTGQRFHVLPSRPAGVQFFRGPRSVLTGRRFSPPVIILRQNFQPRPIGRFVPRGFRGEVRRFPVVRHPVLLDRSFVRFRLHRFHQGFGFPFCSPVFGVGLAISHFGLFHHDLACFPPSFLSPFFFPLAPVVGSAVLLAPPPLVYAGTPLAVAGNLETPVGEPSSESYASSAEPPPVNEPTAPSEQRASRRLTLLQLKDGSMYALADYWLADGSLHYITSYAGENALPIERIDLDRTVQLNAERGVEFVLRPRPASR